MRDYAVIIEKKEYNLYAVYEDGLGMEKIKSFMSLDEFMKWAIYNDLSIAHFNKSRKYSDTIAIRRLEILDHL